MTNTVTLTEPTVDSLLPTWVGFRLERGVSATNLGSFAFVANIPYVAGQTTYEYIDGTGALSDWYRVARYTGGGTISTFSQPWPVTPQTFSTGDGARRSLKNNRRVLARRLGSLQLVTATADGSADGTSIVSRGLATIVDPNRYRSWWAMPTDGVSAGEIRVIGENALNPTIGQLLVAPPFLSQIVQGTQVELLQKLPPDESVGPVIGLRQCLNLALAELWTLDRLAVAATGSTTLDITSFGQWLDPAAISELYGPQIGGLPLAPYGSFAARTDAAVAALDVVGLAAGSSVTIELTRPGDTYIKTGGVWTDNQNGFVYDDDECLFQPALLSEVALAHAYVALANSTKGADQTRYQRLADEQRRTVNTMKRIPGALPRPSEREHRGSLGDEWNAGRDDVKSYWTF